MRDIAIGRRLVGERHSPFIVAEAGINHNGDAERAIAMVQAANEAGVDAVKFQTFKATEFVGVPAQTYSYRSQGRLVTESMLDMFRRCELPRAAWFDIKAECDRLGIVFLSTPQNRSDLDLLLEVGVPAIKVGSDDFTNTPLLRSYAATGLPLILSCGMADLREVRRSLETANASLGNVILLLCTSQYPTPPADVNLRRLATLRAEFPDLPLGFSDHTQGAVAASAAAAFGTCVYEKHFTLSHDLPGPDHWFSEEPEGLAHWVAAIRKAHEMLGSARVEPTSAEIEMRKLARRSVVAISDIGAGEHFTEQNIALRRPGTGMPADMFEQVIGKTAARAIRAGTALHPGDVAHA